MKYYYSRTAQVLWEIVGVQPEYNVFVSDAYLHILSCMQNMTNLNLIFFTGYYNLIQTALDDLKSENMLKQRKRRRNKLY